MNTTGRILIVDDDPDFTEVTRTVLRSKGYQVDTASAGIQALARMRQERPDLVLLDVMMDWPLEGVSISRDMMKNRELRRIPIIMITSIRSSEYRSVSPLDEYLHIGSWVDKPCAPQALLGEIESVLAKHRSSALVV